MTNWVRGHHYENSQKNVSYQEGGWLTSEMYKSCIIFGNKKTEMELI